MQPKNTAPPAPPTPPAPPAPPTPPASSSWFASLFGSKPKTNLLVTQGGRRRRGKKTHRKRATKKTRKGARRH